MIIVAKKKEETTKDYNWQEAIADLDLSDMMKKGLEYYITVKKLNPKNEKDLVKIMDDYKKLPVGV